MTADSSSHEKVAFFTRPMVALVRLTLRFPIATLELAGVLTIFSVLYTAQGLGYRTSRLDLLNPNTGWYGYDYLINRRVVDEKSTTLMRYDPMAVNGPWLEVARLKYRYSGNALEMAVPRKLLGLTGQAFTFDFHWCDNPADLKDPISLCTSGDSAPNRRFNYRCIWKKVIQH